jgi:hypothetical protein
MRTGTTRLAAPCSCTVTSSCLRLGGGHGAVRRHGNAYQVKQSMYLMLRHVLAPAGIGIDHMMAELTAWYAIRRSRPSDANGSAYDLIATESDGQAGLPMTPDLWHGLAGCTNPLLAAWRSIETIDLDNAVECLRLHPVYKDLGEDVYCNRLQVLYEAHAASGRDPRAIIATFLLLVSSRSSETSVLYTTAVPGDDGETWTSLDFARLWWSKKSSKLVWLFITKRKI